MGRVHIRLEPELLRRIETQADSRRVTRTRVIVELIEQGVAATERTLGTVQDSVEALTGQLEALHQFVAESAAGLEAQGRATQDGLNTRMDRLLRAGIESVMILRRLAEKADPMLLAAAQAAAREFVRERTAGPSASDSSPESEARSA